jgi:hypothetical protein
VRGLEDIFVIELSAAKWNEQIVAEELAKNHADISCSRALVLILLRE